jgi:hypothetical protein
MLNEQDSVCADWAIGVIEKDIKEWTLQNFFW